MNIALRRPLLLVVAAFALGACNKKEADLAQEAGAAIRVEDMGQAVRTAIALATRDDRRAKASKAALAFAGAHRGAAAKTAKVILALL